jgi:hypothetical protein
MKKINKTLYDINQNILNRIQEELGFDDDIMEVIMSVVRQETIMAYELGYQNGKEDGYELGQCQ